MAVDLESVRKEIEEYLEGTDLAVFHAFANALEGKQVFWDTSVQPDFRAFLTQAQRVGIKLVVMTKESFSLDEIDDVRDDLEASDLSREEKRALEGRLQELQKYEGFTSRLDLWFPFDGFVYTYRLETEWLRAWEDLMIEIDSSLATEESDDGDSMSGYFSAN
jgi:hypothetical protein